MSRPLDFDAHAARAAGNGFTAASRSAAVRSGILIWAISSACARVSLPTLSVCGRGLPFASFNAFLISTDAGGVLMMKVKLLSGISSDHDRQHQAGLHFLGCALNALQNSMMLSPR